MKCVITKSLYQARYQPSGDPIYGPCPQADTWPDTLVDNRPHILFLGWPHNSYLPLKLQKARSSSIAL